MQNLPPTLQQLFFYFGILSFILLIGYLILRWTGLLKASQTLLLGPGLVASALKCSTRS